MGDLVELRLIGAENTESEARRLMWTYHTFHLHGYNFNVMSMGFPITDDQGTVLTGQYLYCRFCSKNNMSHSICNIQYVIHEYVTYHNICNI